MLFVRACALCSGTLWQPQGDFGQRCSGGSRSCRVHACGPTHPQDMPKLEEYLAVAKRVCLYLARTHPQFTIDQLETEVSKQVRVRPCKL